MPHGTGFQSMAYSQITLCNNQRRKNLSFNYPVKKEINKVIQPVFEVSMFFVNEERNLESFHSCYNSYSAELWIFNRNFPLSIPS
jgi:hypothetical protein